MNIFHWEGTIESPLADLSLTDIILILDHLTALLVSFNNIHGALQKFFHKPLG